MSMLLGMQDMGTKKYLGIYRLGGLSTENGCREGHGFHDCNWGQCQPVSNVTNGINVVHAGFGVLIYHNCISFVDVHASSLQQRSMSEKTILEGSLP